METNYTSLAEQIFSRRQKSIDRLSAVAREAMTARNTLYAARKDARNRSSEIELFKTLKHIPGFFPTPQPLIDRLLDLAEIEAGMLCLEPSAGKGNISLRLLASGASVDVCEINSDLRKILGGHPYRKTGSDFLAWPAVPQYHRIVMNPPFEKGQDREHIRIAYDHLLPGGRVVAVASRGMWSRSFTADRQFKEWATKIGCSVEHCPDDSFQCSERPTGVSTVILTIDKPH